MALPEPVERVFDLIESNPYFRPPWAPYPKQLYWLSLLEREAMIGGAAFGGKTVAQLMRALLYAHVPGYNAVCFRRTFPELEEPGGFIDLSHQWLAGTDASWHGGKSIWTFPTGQRPMSGSGGVSTPNSTLRFKHIQHDKDAVKLSKGATYQTMCWGELTTFTRRQYRLPQARLRRPADDGVTPLARVPLAARSDTNPGGEGHEWVKEDFIDSPHYWNPEANDGAGAWEVRRFIPAWIHENVHGDREGYRASLAAALDAVELARLMEGNWDVIEEGEVFNTEKLVVVQPHEVPDGLSWVRAWDTAGSKKKHSKYTAGARLAVQRGDDQAGRPMVTVWISDINRFMEKPGKRDDRIKAQAELDGTGTRILIEKGGGDAGIAQADAHVALLAGYDVRIERVSGDKVTRAGPFAAQWNHGNVRIVTGPWVGPLKSEAQLFKESAKYKDQIDALSLAFNDLAGAGTPFAYTSGRKKTPARPGRRRLATPRRKVFG